MKAKFTEQQVSQAMLDLKHDEQALRFGFALVIGAMIGFVILVSMAVFLEFGFVWIMPLSIGLAVHFIANVYSKPYRLACGIVAMTLFLLSLVIFEDAKWLIALTPIAFAFGYALAKRPLNDLQKKALWLEDLKD